MKEQKYFSIIPCVKLSDLESISSLIRSRGYGTVAAQRSLRVQKKGGTERVGIMGGERCGDRRLYSYHTACILYHFSS